MRLPALAIAAVLLWLGPPGADTAAHVYQRWLWIRHGFVSWDNNWYGGRFTFVTYSWLYYPLAAWVGIEPLAVDEVRPAAIDALGDVFGLDLEAQPADELPGRWPQPVLSAAATPPGSG